MNQSRRLPPSFLPSQLQVLSGSALKTIAIITMLLDHIGVHILNHCAFGRQPLFTLAGHQYSLYRIFRDTGRLAFPIYCFLLVEGFCYTHSRWKYGFNLFLFALLSEIPWDIAHGGTMLRWDTQNVFFTLFLGYLALCVMEYFWEQPFLRLLLLGLLLFISVKLKADYGWRGYGFILIMYCFRSEPTTQTVIGGCWLAFEWKAVFAFLPINMYNGKRGFIHGPIGKYFFYAFYPLHLLVLAYIKYRYFLVL